MKQSTYRSVACCNVNGTLALLSVSGEHVRANTNSTEIGNSPVNTVVDFGNGSATTATLGESIMRIATYVRA